MCTIYWYLPILLLSHFTTQTQGCIALPLRSSPLRPATVLSPITALGTVALLRQHDSPHHHALP